MHLDLKGILRNSQDESHDQISFSWHGQVWNHFLDMNNIDCAVLGMVEEMAWASTHRMTEVDYP